MDRRLIFVSCGTTTAPLIRALASRYDVVVPGAGIAQQLATHGVSAIPWEALADRGRLAAIAGDATARAAAWERQLAEVGDELFAVAGRRRRERFLPAAAETIRARLQEQLLALEFGRTLAATGRLAAAVVHEDVTGAMRAFLAALRAAGVPTVHVPHGIYVHERIIGADVHGDLHADVVAVGGTAQRDWFLSRGVSPERIVVTGNPAWDALGVRSPRGATSDAPLVVFAASWIGREMPAADLTRRLHERWTRVSFTAVTQVRRALPGLRFVLKHHPSATAEEQARVQTLAAETGTVIDEVASGPPAPLLARADALLALPSTIVIEAMLLGTPVVVPEVCYETDAVLCPPATTADVADALGRILGGWGTSPDFARARADFVERYNGPCDGRASARVAALLDDLAARTTPPRTAHAGATARLGFLLLERGAHAEAEAVLGDAVARDAGCADGWCGLGVLAALRGERPRAVSLLARALAIDPAHVEATQALQAIGVAGETSA